MSVFAKAKEAVFSRIPGIAPEGRDMVSFAAVIALLAMLLLGWWSLPFWLGLAFVVQFFRDPERIPPDGEDLENIALSPADGRVVFMGIAPSPLDDSPSLKISVFMNVFNVHANRIPTAGTVAKSEHFPGAFLNAALDKASEKNERHLLALDTPRGRVVCVQIAGLVARRISCDAREGEMLPAGTRYGFIRFGSRVDLHLSPEAEPLAALGDVVFAGQTRLARLARDKDGPDNGSDFPDGRAGRDGSDGNGPDGPGRAGRGGWEE